MFEANGDEVFTSLPKLQGASPYYQLGRTLSATGIYDGRVYTTPACGLQLYVYGDNLHFPKTYFTNANGFCGGNQKVDTALVSGVGYVKRGVALYQDSTDCGSSNCHTYPAGYQSVRQRPVPVVLNHVKATKGTLDPASPSNVQFINWFTPDSVTVSGNKTPHPYTVTLWQWIGADGTRDPILPGRPGCGAFRATLICNYAPPESGRMLTNVFVGGWEQQSSITVQCYLALADSALNDSTSDFKTREMILDMPTRSDNDSSVNGGFDRGHPGWSGGWRHETAIAVWRMPGGGFQTDTIAAITSNACAASYYIPSPPVPGATLFATGHSHPGHPGERLYCGDTVTFKGRRVPSAATPNDTLTLPSRLYPGDSADADRADRNRANSNRGPEYVIAGGVVMRISPAPGPTYPNLQTFYRVSGGSATERKCAWVKKLQ